MASVVRAEAPALRPLFRCTRSTAESISGQGRMEFANTVFIQGQRLPLAEDASQHGTWTTRNLRSLETRTRASWCETATASPGEISRASLWCPRRLGFTAKGHRGHTPLCTVPHARARAPIWKGHIRPDRAVEPPQSCWCRLAELLASWVIARLMVEVPRRQRGRGDVSFIGFELGIWIGV